jgi:hypothetical protein
MKYILCVILVVLVGCQKQSEEIVSQGEYKVEKLFTHEGCTVYRFHDAWTVYYTNCKGQAQSQHNCGNGCMKTDVVTTEIK